MINTLVQTNNCFLNFSDQQLGIIDAEVDCKDLAAAPGEHPCPLCPVDTWKPKKKSKLENHMERFHKKHSFCVQGNESSLFLFLSLSHAFIFDPDILDIKIVHNVKFLHGVWFVGVRIMACKLNCQDRVHYHCLCGKVSRLRQVALRHSTHCSAMTAVSPSSSPTRDSCASSTKLKGKIVI